MFEGGIARVKLFVMIESINPIQVSISKDPLLELLRDPVLENVKSDKHGTVTYEDFIRNLKSNPEYEHSKHRLE
jgi:Ca2+-binding EF-hand superfamily protein